MLQKTVNGRLSLSLSLSLHGVELTAFFNLILIITVEMNNRLVDAKETKILYT